MKITKSPGVIVALLTIIFCIPGLSAIWLYTHPEWLLVAKTNNGVLLNPPYQMKTKQKRAKWHIYYWHPGVCEKACLNYLDRLARVRLALGRKLYDVDLHWLRPSESGEIAQNLKQQLQQQDVVPSIINAKDTGYFYKMAAGNEVFIANPDNYLILSYGQLQKPMDLYRDVKHLLSVPAAKGKRHA